MKLIIKNEFKTIEIDDIQIGTNPPKGCGTFYPAKKHKCLAPIDEEMFKNIKEFAENFTTEARLQQGIFVMKNEMLLEPTPQNTGNFIKWVVSDVIKEEQANIVNNGLDVKKIAREVGNIARLWYNNQL